MSIHIITFQQMNLLTKRELKLKLSQVQNEVHRNSTKMKIITQIRLNFIVEIERSVQNE